MTKPLFILLLGTALLSNAAQAGSIEDRITVLSGPVDKQAIADGLHPHRQQIDECLGELPPGGAITATMQLNASGRLAKRVNLKTNQRFERSLRPALSCLNEQIADWVMPRPVDHKDKTNTVFEYQLTSKMAQ